MSWVSEQIFAAGGSVIPRDWQQFQTQTGIAAVVHLNAGAALEFRGPQPQRFLWLDVDDEEHADEARRFAAGSFVLQAVQDGERVLLHAAAGRHRTRWIYVAYLILSGCKALTAVRMAEQRPWLAPYRTDLQQWEHFRERFMYSGPGGSDAV